MPNSQVVCAYAITATAEAVGSLALAMAAVPLDLATPQLWGLFPSADVTTQASPVVTRSITLKMGTTYTSTAGIFKNDLGTPKSGVEAISVQAGVHTDYAVPPVLSVVDTAGKGSGVTGRVFMGLGASAILSGGAGYSGATTAAIVGGDLMPNGTPGAVSFTLLGGVVNTVTITTPGFGYNRFVQIVFTDPGGGSGAEVYVSLKPVGIQVFQQGNDYVTPELVLTPQFLASTTDGPTQAGPVEGWMTNILAGALLAPVQTLAPVLS